MSVFYTNFMGGAFFIVSILSTISIERNWYKNKYWDLASRNILERANKIIFTPILCNRKGYLRENHIII